MRMSRKALIVAFVVAILLLATVFSLFYLNLLSHQSVAPSKLPEQQEIEQSADASPQPTEDSTATQSDSQIVIPESPSPSTPSLPRFPPTSLPYLSPDNSTLSSEQNKQSPELGAHFEFDVVYAYVHSYISGGVHGLSDYLVFNITFVSDAETNSSDGIVDTFLVEICSGEQVIGRGTFGFCSKDWSLSNLCTLLPRFMSEYSGLHMTSSGSWVANKPCLCTNSVTIFKITDTGIISVRVQRIEWLSTSTETNSHSLTLVEQVQLEKFGNGFLYNTLVPEDQLSQIDLFNPPYPPSSATNLGYAFTAEFRR